jgi:hypothetical protein
MDEGVSKMIYDEQRDPTLDNKMCHYCSEEIPFSNNIPEDIILFCDLECYGQKCMEDE